MRINPETLRRLRQEQGLTVHQLAAKAGVAHTVVSRAEAGRNNPHPASVRKLAEALGVSVSTLIDWKDAGTEFRVRG